MLSADLVIYSTTAGGGFERGVSDSYREFLFWRFPHMCLHDRGSLRPCDFV